MSLFCLETITNLFSLKKSRLFEMNDQSEVGFGLEYFNDNPLLYHDYTMKYNTQKEKFSCNFILAMVQSKEKEGYMCV